MLLKARQIASSKPNSSFTLPTNHVSPCLSAWSFQTSGCSVPNFAISQLDPEGFSRATNTKGDNNATVRQVVYVIGGGSVYYLNQSAGPNLEGGGQQINVSSTALMSVGGPEVIPTAFIAAPRMELTAFTVQDLTQLLASSSEDNLPARKLVQYNADPLQGHGWFGLFDALKRLD